MRITLAACVWAHLLEGYVGHNVQETIWQYRACAAHLPLNVFLMQIKEASPERKWLLQRFLAVGFL